VLPLDVYNLHKTKKHDQICKSHVINFSSA
jgi:hypothetical protein